MSGAGPTRLLMRHDKFSQQKNGFPYTIPLLLIIEEFEKKKFLKLLKMHFSQMLDHNVEHYEM